MDDRVCVLCGRSGTRGFIPRKWFMGPKVGHNVWICRSAHACNERRRKGGPDVRRDTAPDPARNPIRPTGLIT